MKSSTLPFFIMLLFLLFSCNDSPTKEKNIMLERGEYKGIYKVTHNVGEKDENTTTCNTELSLNSDGYSIKEITYICPPKSAGTYELTSSTISFNDTIPHTDEFDPTLIIHGTYDYLFDGSTLEMTQIETIYTGEIRNYIYKLVKQD